MTEIFDDLTEDVIFFTSLPQSTLFVIWWTFALLV